MVFLFLAPANNDAANRSVLNGGVRARSRPPGTENTVPTQGSMVLPELPTRPVSSGRNEYSRSSLIGSSRNQGYLEHTTWLFCGMQCKPLFKNFYMLTFGLYIHILVMLKLEYKHPNQF